MTINFKIRLLFSVIVLCLCSCQDTSNKYEVWDHRTNERFVVNGMPYGHPDYLGWPKNFYGFTDTEGFERHIPHKHSSCRKLGKIK